MFRRFVSMVLGSFVVTLAIAAFFGVIFYLVQQSVSKEPVGEEIADEVQEAGNDVADEETEAVQLGEGEYFVINPTSNAKWYVKVLPAGETALVLVPGGRGYSKDFLDAKKDAQDLVDAGYTVVLFDPEGRGRSEGEEDDNGTIGQDGLKAVVAFAGGLEGIERVGISSFSYGITMASGMLSRYPDVAVAFLIDWEGPANRTHTGGCDADSSGHLEDEVACDDEVYWSEREAETFIGSIRVPYQRIQTERDHAQPDYDHTVDMVNAAIMGSAPWVRLNDDEPNLSYTQPAVNPLPEPFDRNLMTGVAEYADYFLASVLPSLE